MRIGLEASRRRAGIRSRARAGVWEDSDCGEYPGISRSAFISMARARVALGRSRWREPRRLRGIQSCEGLRLMESAPGSAASGVLDVPEADLRALAGALTARLRRSLCPVSLRADAEPGRAPTWAQAQRIQRRFGRPRRCLESHVALGAADRPCLRPSAKLTWHSALRSDVAFGRPRLCLEYRVGTGARIDVAFGLRPSAPVSRVSRGPRRYGLTLPSAIGAGVSSITGHSALGSTFGLAPMIRDGMRTSLAPFDL